MNYKKHIKKVPLFFFAAFIGLATSANSAPTATDATVLAAVVVSQDTALSFGTFSSSAVAGSVNFLAGDPITAGGGVILLGGEQTGVAFSPRPDYQTPLRSPSQSLEPL